MSKKPANDNSIGSSAAIGIGLICALGAYPAIRLRDKRKPDLFPKIMAGLIVALMAGVTAILLLLAKG